ncbi:MAG: PfkB family carbohydrate kinase [Phycisphaeraceae bacterium]|nr:PfkB family carbohydrate kinase [Phycisphaeraceae bacterium]
MSVQPTIVGIGEALFDRLPGGDERLGGAPLNVAVAARALGAESFLVSRVGHDAEGEQIVQALAERGVPVTYVQHDPDHPTGWVDISFSPQGEPAYEISGSAAWDMLQFDPDLEPLARQCDAVCFGLLAQRTAQSRNTIHRFLAEARSAVRLLDVNRRADGWERRIIERSLEAATDVKGGGKELTALGKMFGIEGSISVIATAVRDRWELKRVVVTDGASGTRLLDQSGWHEGESASFDPAPDADPVGAGDACAAGLLVGLTERWPVERTLGLANAAGAWVASQAGATPAFPDEVTSLAKGASTN